MLLRSLERQRRKQDIHQRNVLSRITRKEACGLGQVALPHFQASGLFILVKENKCPAHLSWDCASLSSVTLQTTVPAYLLSLCPGKTSYSASLAYAIPWNVGLLFPLALPVTNPLLVGVVSFVARSKRKVERIRLLTEPFLSARLFACTTRYLHHGFLSGLILSSKTALFQRSSVLSGILSGRCIRRRKRTCIFRSSSKCWSHRKKKHRIWSISAEGNKVSTSCQVYFPFVSRLSR